jgi:putative transposase
MDRLAKLLSKTHTSGYAWVLIAKHAYFLFRTGNVTLATLIRRLIAGYAVSFNPAFSGTTSVMVNSFSPRHRICCGEGRGYYLVY